MSKSKEKHMHPTRIFKTPEELEAAWEEYKKHLHEVESKQWTKVQYVGRDGDRREDPQKIPFTLDGFKRFCRKNYGEVHNYFTNAGEYYDDFNTICTHVREEIRENQIIGGMLGFYNPSITQRLNNLTEKVETSQAQTVTVKGISQEELDEMLEND